VIAIVEWLVIVMSMIVIVAVRKWMETGVALHKHDSFFSLC
jgi:hypothetical protein